MPKSRLSTAKTPSYRHRPGYDQALVTLTDAVTRRRRDYWLGEAGTRESRELYHRVIAAWEANDRRLPRHPRDEGTERAQDGPVIIEVIRDFLKWARVSVDTGELRSYVIVLALLRRYAGRMPASQFGPKMMRLIRDEMIRGDAISDPPRRSWSRKYINAQVQRLRRVFKWAAAHELAPVTVYQSLSTLEPLRRGRSAARETDKVGPVSQQLLDATTKFLSPTLQVLVELQLRTGARAGELLMLRPMDLVEDAKLCIWVFRPCSHKTSYRGMNRAIYIGPKAQGLLAPLLESCAQDEYVFDPRKSEAARLYQRHAARKTPLSCGNRPGSNRKDAPSRTPGGRYSTAAYCRAVHRACEAAFPPPPPLGQQPGETRADWRQRIKREQMQDELRQWRRAHSWHPHQLRHNAATNLRREFGLEAAQLALGHASAQITDAVYAERDHAKVVDIMRKIG